MKSDKVEKWLTLVQCHVLGQEDPPIEDMTIDVKSNKLALSGDHYLLLFTPIYPYSMGPSGFSGHLRNRSCK